MSLLRNGVVTEMTTGKAGISGETEVVTYSTGELWDGTSRLIIALHGHGSTGNDLASPQVYNQNTGAGLGAMALARTGRYVVCSIEAGGVASWSKPAVMTDIDTAVTAMRTRGVKPGKYGILGYSMGGLETANKIKRDHANIAAAWTWAPALDMDYNYSTAGHTPIANNATWTSEINTAFGGTTAAQFAGYNPVVDYASYRGLNVHWKICHATDDSVILQSVSTGFVTSVNDPFITMRTPDVTGGHTGLFSNIPDSEIVAHFDYATW